MDIIGSFVSVDSFKIDHVSNDMVLINNSVSSKHVSGNSSDFQGFLTIISFHNGDDTWIEGFRVSFKFPSDLEDSELTQGNFCLHVSELLLWKLEPS